MKTVKVASDMKTAALSQLPKESTLGSRKRIAAVSNITNVYQIVGDIAIALTANIDPSHGADHAAADLSGFPTAV